MLSTIRAALPAMIEKGTGNIVNVASIGGLSGDFRGSLCGISKAGVINLTRYVATQFGHKGIQYCTLFRQSRRYSCYNCFLASDDARYISGQTIVADGGMECHNPTIYDI